MKRNLEFRKIFPETPFNKRSAEYSTQNDDMEWMRDATNPLE